jgi:hypothetical protein
MTFSRQEESFPQHPRLTITGISTMATYVSTVAQLPAPLNLAGVNALPASAPAVQAGSPLDLADVSSAQQEKYKRQRLHSINPALITFEEVANAKVREEAIVAQHVNAKYAGAGQPDWLMPALNQALATALAPIRQELQQQQQHLLQQQQHLQRTEAAVMNQKREAQNARRAPLHLPLFPPFKANPGHPDANPQDPALVALQKPVEVGARLPPLAFIPAAGITRAAIMGLTVAQISDLAWFYNELFAEGEVWCLVQFVRHAHDMTLLCVLCVCLA